MEKARESKKEKVTKKRERQGKTKRRTEGKDLDESEDQIYYFIVTGILNYISVVLLTALFIITLPKYLRIRRNVIDSSTYYYHRTYNK